jgi:hypothetical protein
MNKNLENIWKESLGQISGVVLFQDLSGGLEENDEKSVRIIGILDSDWLCSEYEKCYCLSQLVQSKLVR